MSIESDAASSGLGIFFVSILFFLKLLLSALGFCTKHISFVDCGIFGFVAGYGVYHHFIWHPAFCVLFGLFIFLIFFGLMRLKYPFWVISTVMSIAYAAVLGYAIYEAAKYDKIWGWFSFGIGVLICLGLHFNEQRIKKEEITETPVAV